MYTRNQQDGEIEFSRSDAFLACQTPRVWTLSQLKQIYYLQILLLTNYFVSLQIKLLQ